MLNVGQTKEYIDEATGFNGQIPRIKLEDGPKNLIRIITGPKKTRTVFWRTKYKDPETGEIKPSTKAVLVNPDSVLDKLATVEYRIRTELGETEPRCVFKPVERYAYTAFNYNEIERVVKALDTPKRVSEQLINLQRKLTKDSLHLLHGLIFMFPVVVDKQIDPKKRREQGVSYRVDPDLESPLYKRFTGKVPASWLRLSVPEINEKFVDKWNTIFEEDEIQAIESCPFDIFGEEFRSMTDDEVLTKFLKFPIDLDAVDVYGRKYFTNPEVFMEKLKEYEIKFLDTKTPVAISQGSTKQSTEAPKKEEKPQETKPQEEKKVETKPKNEDNISDAVFSEVPPDNLNLEGSSKEGEMDLSFLE